MKINHRKLVSCLSAIILLLVFIIYVKTLASLTSEYQKKNKELKQIIVETNELISRQSDLINEILTTTKHKGPEEQISNRGCGSEYGEKRTMECTAYDLSYQSCEKHPDDPLYGITASGKKVEAWNTVAAGREFPFGTKLYIPYFKNAPNQGIFTVHDRGGAIKDGQLDIYMENYNDCINFGRQQLDVYIIDEIQR